MVDADDDYDVSKVYPLLIFTFVSLHDSEKE